MDLNRASAKLLEHVSGISPKLAAALVAARATGGPFATRASIVKRVKGVGPKTFEQCAGFLRVTGGPEPLDATPTPRANFDDLEGAGCPEGSRESRI